MQKFTNVEVKSLQNLENANNVEKIRGIMKIKVYFSFCPAPSKLFNK